MLSLRRAPNLGTSWCPHRVCAQPDSGTIDIFFLVSSPLFSHPHGICRHISKRPSIKLDFSRKGSDKFKELTTMRLSHP